MSVRVEIKYNGKYLMRAGVRSEEISVSENIDDAYKTVMEHLKQRHAIEPPFLLMVRNLHVMGAVKKNLQLCEGDSFNVLPFLSGG